MFSVRLTALILAVSIFVACSDDKKKTDSYTGASVKQPVAVEAVKVTKGVISRTISSSGVISGVREATVVSEAQGVIRSVSFDLGKKVARNSVLLKVDDKVQKLDLETARLQLETADRNLQVARALVSKGGSSQADVQNALTAQAAAKGAYERALKAFNDCMVKAPIAGYIASRDQSATAGNYINFGVNVARIVDLRRLRTEVPVGEGEVDLIKAGSPAVVKVNTGCQNGRMEARVTAVSAGAASGSGSFIVAVEWENPCGPDIRSGMSASVIIPSTGQDTVVVVPTAALIKRERRDVVLLAVGDRVVVRPVRKGHMSGNRTEIVEGVVAGDVVIMSALGTLAPNNPVTVSVVGESGTWK